jgi:hypothetical protein
MLFTKQFIKSVSYTVSKYISNRKISNSCSEDYNIFSTIYLTKLINNDNSIILDRINKIEKTLEKNNNFITLKKSSIIYFIIL